jgi:endogenous inhibitor of DNA gyrase (YacG/DUF329 family)
MTCPICRKPTAPAWRPFCSRRCADIDLGRWLTEGYAIPAEQDEEEASPRNDPPDP